MNNIRPADVIKNIPSNVFKIVQKYETIDTLWGIEHRKLTDDDITALKEGKYLYCNDGEYAQLISYETQEKEDNITYKDISKMVEDLSERVENIERQIKEDKEEQLKKLKAELEYAKFRCALPTVMDMMKIR